PSATATICFPSGDWNWIPSREAGSARLSNRMMIDSPGLAPALPAGAGVIDRSFGAPMAIGTAPAVEPQEVTALSVNVGKLEPATAAEPAAARPDRPGVIETVSASCAVHCRVTFPGLSSVNCDAETKMNVGGAQETVNLIAAGR